LPDYVKNQRVDVSAKLDGLSVVLYYTKGILSQALTRGDGEIGIDITDKARYILGKSIVDKTFTGAVRGEIIMTNRALKRTVFFSAIDFIYEVQHCTYRLQNQY
jgi:NAD-dependent DNA ligase